MTATTSEPKPRVEAMAYAPGLDGVRAVAVSAVVVYHLNASSLPGGFLGVDVFFVVSGFLITSLLVREHRARGRINIARFYCRRARRLLPALFVMLVVVVLSTAVLSPGDVYQLRGDVVAAISYCSNWTQISFGRSYFGARPSLLQHLWSLAVEEQFYLAWPLILLALLYLGRPRLPLIVTVSALGASTLWAAILYHPGSDPSRIYYGTDTHAGPLLAGAALAFMVESGWRMGRGRADAVAVCGAVVLALCCLRVDYFSSFLYRGGYLVVAFAAGAVVAAAARTDTATAFVLSRPVLRWLGVRSYGIYLWHWPVLMLIGPRQDVAPATTSDTALRLGLTLALAALSYRLIEQPIRRHGLAATYRATGPVRGDGRNSVQRPTAALVASVATILAVTSQLANPGAATSVQNDTRPRPRIHISAKSRGFTRPVAVTFFGDSQAMTLLLNRPAGLEASFRLTDGSVEGCGILGGTVTSRRGPSRNLDRECSGWQAKWRKTAAKSHPQIAVVEIGAWEVFDDRVGGSTLIFGTPAWDAEFRRHLLSAVTLLTDTGAQVALLKVPCYRPIDAGGLLALPERGDDKRTRHLNALMAHAAAHSPSRVFTVSAPHQFCDDPSVATNTGYRWDGVHYYKAGAALMFKTIAPQLLNIPAK
ncbi:MAG: acyltransferase family protein [Pseudonocardiales bacterium]